MLEKTYRPESGVYHAYFEEQARVEGLLNDQVQLANAALDAFEVTGTLRYLEVAKDLMNYTSDHLLGHRCRRVFSIVFLKKIPWQL